MRDLDVHKRYERALRYKSTNVLTKIALSGFSIPDLQAFLRAFYNRLGQHIPLPPRLRRAGENIAVDYTTLSDAHRLIRLAKHGILSPKDIRSFVLDCVSAVPIIDFHTTFPKSMSNDLVRLHIQMKWLTLLTGRICEQGHRFQDGIRFKLPRYLSDDTVIAFERLTSTLSYYQLEHLCIMEHDWEHLDDFCTLLFVLCS